MQDVRLVSFDVDLGQLVSHGGEPSALARLTAELAEIDAAIGTEIDTVPRVVGRQRHGE